jgi:hypothetical protein
VTVEEQKLSWGYTAGVPKGVKAAWGARLILNRDSYRYGGEMLHDRQSGFGSEEDRNRLQTALNKVKPWGKPLATLISDGEVLSTQENEVVVYEDDTIMVVGNSNGSYGYFYLAAYLK